MVFDLEWAFCVLALDCPIKTRQRQIRLVALR